MLAFAVFGAVYFLLNQNLTVASILLLLVLNLKPQAIVFTPPLFLLGIYKLYGKISVADLLKSIFACVFIELILVLPFLLKGEMQGIVNVYLHAMGYHPKVSIAAFNVWVFLLGKSCFVTSDEVKWGVFTYKQIGLLMFFTASVLALLPLFLATLSKFIKQLNFTLSKEVVLLSFALIPLLFFFLNTEMHERYSHPAMIFIAAYSFLSRKYYLFLLFCLAYFCNLEPRLYALGLSNYNILIFEPYFVAGLFALQIVFLYFFLYNTFLNHKNIVNE